jgi:hypothetical protein
MLVWLEEGGVEAVKAVQDAGISKKALFKGVSSLQGLVKCGSAVGRANSLRYQHNSQPARVWGAYLKHVGEGPLSQNGHPCLMVSLKEVGGVSTFGDSVITRLDGLSCWTPKNFGHSFFNRRADEAGFVGSKTAYQVREIIAEHVVSVLGTHPTKPDMVGKMAKVVQSRNNHWTRRASGFFAGNNGQKTAAANKYVRDAYNDLVRQTQVKFVAQLTLATKVDMVVLCLLAWYDQLTKKQKKEFGHTR